MSTPTTATRRSVDQQLQNFNLDFNLHLKWARTPEDFAVLDAALEQCFAALRFRLPSDLAEEQEAEAEAAEWLEANIPSAWEVHQ